jgi:uncharacterized protein (DUF1015 family)
LVASAAVALVRPFRALAYDEAEAGPLGALVAPPYDVISAPAREGYLRASPYNVVRLILPEVPYEEVPRLLAEWREAGVLRRAAHPCMLAWTQSFRLADGVPRERRTIVATVGLEPYERRVVRPHERTHAGPREDRLRLMRAARAQLSPVFGLYPDAEGCVWRAAGVEGPPHAEFTDRDGTVHRIWRIDDVDACSAVSAGFAGRWILIADGHHRYETALAYRGDRTRVGAGPTRPDDVVLMGLTALEDPGLAVLATHRLLTEWPEGAASRFEVVPVIGGLEDLLAALEEAPRERPAFGLVLPDRQALLVGEHGEDASPAGRLDTVALERDLLEPALGADQAVLAARGALSYTQDPVEAQRAVHEGRAAAAVLLRHPSVAMIADVAEAGGTMPQKSTYVTPKLLTGVAFHALDDD